MTTDIDLTNCDQEPIQYAGAIQPHAALLVLREPDLCILQVSANSQTYLGMAPESLLGQDIQVLLGEAETATLRARLARLDLSRRLVSLMTARPVTSGDSFHVQGNRIDGVLLLEFERVDEGAHAGAPDLYQEVHAVLQHLEAAPSLQDFFDATVEAIRRLTGMDRVLAYRFAADGSGEVMAESVRDGLESYLGLHYPAADIPEPARRLFSLSWVRHLPDVDYAPVPLIPLLNPTTGTPLDLTHLFSRSVSVMYTDYLRNMGVKATLVTTLLKDGRLWGLVTCMNHEVPRYLPRETRMAVECFAHSVSLLMGAKEGQEQHAYQMRLNAARDRLLSRLLKAGELQETLSQAGSDLLDAIDAAGVALLFEGGLSLFGETPSETEVRGLMDWLATRDETQFVSHQLGLEYPPATVFQSIASGLLAVRFSSRDADGLLWFRREWQHSVHWAGDPHKPVEVDRSRPEVRLLPRTSFALWKEAVAGQSRPWLACEIQHARELRRGILDLLVSHTNQLRRVNSELAASNQELDTFAYAASHDLKEPLRGIHNSAQFLREDEGDQLSEQGRRRLTTILNLARHMNDLIESLLYFSRVGRIELTPRTLDLRAVVVQALEGLRPLLDETGVRVEIEPDLPEIQGDPVRVGEIFANLIANAAKYNDKPHKWIRVGCNRQCDPLVFCVRDNGIGIAEKHFDRIFQIFRRLHGAQDYGGGTGAGLTIARKAVERHGGGIWLESTPGEGTAFFFTLAPKP